MMDLQAFGSIFELFATFALAYILIDEFTANPFIALITEKILRKYKVIDKIYDDIRKEINGVRNSIDEIAQWEIGDNDLKNDYSRMERKLSSTETRCDNSFNEIRTIIQGNYSTKVFGYLNCYLFFYCLIILFYGGVYSSNTWAETDPNVGDAFRARIDTSLFIFTAYSLIWISLGWKFDTNKKEDNELGLAEKLYRGNIFNGYVLAFILGIIGAGLGIASFFLKWNFIPAGSLGCHNGIVITCIIIPMLNFVSYVVKASLRANSCMSRVKELAKNFKTDYVGELGPINEYISACGYHKSKNLKLHK